MRAGRVEADPLYWLDEDSRIIFFSYLQSLWRQWTAWREDERWLLLVLCVKGLIRTVQVFLQWLLECVPHASHLFWKPYFLPSHGVLSPLLCLWSQSYKEMVCLPCLPFLFIKKKIYYFSVPQKAKASLACMICLSSFISELDCEFYYSLLARSSCVVSGAVGNQSCDSRNQSVVFLSFPSWSFCQYSLLFALNCL